MTRRGFYECNLCGEASTDETLFRGVVIDPEDPKKRMIADAFASDKHVCIQCVRFLSEYQLRSDVDSRRM